LPLDEPLATATPLQASSPAVGTPLEAAVSGPQVRSDSSRHRGRRKKGPPWVALAGGVLLLGIAVAVGMMAMTGGDDPPVAEGTEPTSQRPQPRTPKKAPEKQPKKTPEATNPPEAKTDKLENPQPPKDPLIDPTSKKDPPPSVVTGEAQNPIEVAVGGEPTSFEFPRTDDQPENEPGVIVESGTKKASVPSHEALKKAKSEIRNIFDLKSATNLAARAKLIKDILATALESDSDRAAQFAMFTMARDMAVFLGDYALADRVIGQLDKRFDVDAVAMRSKAVIRAMTAKVPAENRITAAHAALELTRKLHDADRYDEAKTIVTAVQRASGRLRNRELTLATKQLADDVREAANHYRPAREAFATLKTSPDDPGANMVAGKYLCFIKGEWERGLPMLAKGDDAKLKKLAAKELAGVEDAKPTDVDAIVKLGDAWWKLAQQEKGPNKKTILRRAGHWYEQVVDQSKGLVKVRIQKRLAILLTISSDRKRLRTLPIARWDFDRNLQDSVGRLHCVAAKGAYIKRGVLVLDGTGAHVRTPALSQTLTEKTLEVWVVLENLNQQGGGVITVQSLTGDKFDSIVFAERERFRWMAGSEHHRRSMSLQGPPEDSRGPIHLAMVYDNNGTVACYRNGKVLGKPYKAKSPVEFKAGKSMVVFGVRIIGVGASLNFKGGILCAQLFDKALSHQEVVTSFKNGPK
jgi:hypothetical protein